MDLFSSFLTNANSTTLDFVKFLLLVKELIQYCERLYQLDAAIGVTVWTKDGGISTKDIPSIYLVEEVVGSYYPTHLNFYLKDGHYEKSIIHFPQKGGGLVNQ